MDRYQAISLKTGKVVGTGKTLSSVQAMGDRIIIDYKTKRHTVQGLYPVARPVWDVREWRKQCVKISSLLSDISYTDPTS